LPPIHLNRLFTFLHILRVDSVDVFVADGFPYPLAILFYFNMHSRRHLEVLSLKNM